MVEENNLGILSIECKVGNHDICSGKLEPSGVQNCQCKHHHNTPIYVDDTPVSKDISNIKVERIRAKLKSCAGPFSLEWLTKPEY